MWQEYGPFSDIPELVWDTIHILADCQWDDVFEIRMRVFDLLEIV